MTVNKRELRASLTTLLDHAVIAYRHPRQRAVLRLAAGVLAGFRAALTARGFTEVQTPKIVATATESGANVFRLDYFGRPASTHKAVALLSLEFRVPVLVVGMPRVGEPMRYRQVCADLILPEEFDGRPDAVKAITQRYSSALERLVRAAPEQYLWLHRRWKHQPPPKKSKRAA